MRKLKINDIEKELELAVAASELATVRGKRSGLRISALAAATNLRNSAAALPSASCQGHAP